jgi:transglutaminase-like putative cysteine protease
MLNKIGIFTLTSLFLLLVAFSSLSYGLQSAVPILKEYPLLLFTSLGLMIGWILARSQLAGWKIVLISTVIGSIVIIFDIADLLSPFLYLGQESINVLYYTLKWPWNNSPDLNVLLLLLSDISSNIIDVLSVTYQWFVSLTKNQTLLRSSGAVLIWLLTTWITSIWAGCTIQRIKKPIISILPAGILLASTMNYVRTDTYLLLIFLLSTLSLTAYFHYSSHQENWELNELDYPEDIRIDYTYAIGVILFILTSIAIITPSLSIRPLASAVKLALSEQKNQIDFVADSLGFRGQNINIDLAGDPRSTGLPRSHLLGSDPQLSQEVVMIVESPELEQAKFYWRGVTYDIYDGRSWSTSEIYTSSYLAGDRITQIIYPSQQVITQNFYIRREDGGRLFTAGNILSADKDIEVSWRSSNDIFGALITSSTYEVSSFLNQISEKQLRSANEDYPDWIKEQYLNLPNEIPARINQLASDLTYDKLSAYDKALSIEAYLKRFPYSLDVPSPPEGRDVSDYFLFDLKKGYCDYYATSMVVLARAAGLPARLVIGYTGGRFDAENHRYIVTEADAHSWVEIFFPKYGWIEFEPTSGRSISELPADVSHEFLLDFESQNSELPLDRSAGEIALWKIILFASMIFPAIVVGIKLLYDYRNFRNFDPGKIVNILYQRIKVFGKKIEVPPRPSDTPKEFELALTRKIDEITNFFPTDIPTSQINQYLIRVTNYYIQGSYSPHPLRETEKAAAMHSWQYFRFWTLIIRFAYFLKKIYRWFLELNNLS